MGWNRCCLRCGQPTGLNNDPDRKWPIRTYGQNLWSAQFNTAAQISKKVCRQTQYVRFSVVCYHFYIVKIDIKYLHLFNFALIYPNRLYKRGHFISLCWVKVHEIIKVNVLICFIVNRSTAWKGLFVTTKKTDVMSQLTICLIIQQSY